METPLILPTEGLRTRRDASGREQIWDGLRGKWVAATPEERVRQCFVRYLVGALGYWPARMSNEVSLSLNGTRRRVDTVVYDDFGRPAALVEYKAPGVKISRGTIDQIVRYNLVMGAPYLFITNGLHIYCCHVDLGDGAYAFLSALPRYEALRRRAGV